MEVVVHLLWSTTYTMSVEYKAVDSYILHEREIVSNHRLINYLLCFG